MTRVGLVRGRRGEGGQRGLAWTTLGPPKRVSTAARMVAGSRCIVPGATCPQSAASNHSTAREFRRRCPMCRRAVQRYLTVLNCSNPRFRSGFFLY